MQLADVDADAIEIVVLYFSTLNCRVSFNNRKFFVSRSGELRILIEPGKSDQVLLLLIADYLRKRTVIVDTLFSAEEEVTASVIDFLNAHGIDWSRPVNQRAP